MFEVEGPVGAAAELRRWILDVRDELRDVERALGALSSLELALMTGWSGDVLTSEYADLAASLAILLAVTERERHGRGQCVLDREAEAAVRVFVRSLDGCATPDDDWSPRLSDAAARSRQRFGERGEGPLTMAHVRSLEAVLRRVSLELEAESTVAVAMMSSRARSRW